jgi:hypothetical protein
MSRKSVPFNQKTASTQERDIGIASKHPWSMIWDEDIHRLRGATPETAGAFLALIPQLRLGDPQGYLSRDGRAIETKSLALVTGLDQRVIGDALRALKKLEILDRTPKPDNVYFHPKLAAYFRKRTGKTTDKTCNDLKLLKTKAPTQRIFTREDPQTKVLRVE